MIRFHVSKMVDEDLRDNLDLVETVLEIIAGNFTVRMLADELSSSKDTI